MWFLGMLAGLVVGGIIGDGAGAIAGAILGTLAGAIYRANNPSQPRDDGAYEHRIADLERRVDHIYKSLEDIHWRLSALEKPGAQRDAAAGAPSTAASATNPSAEMPRAVEPAAIPAAAVTSAPAAAAVPSVLTVEEALAMDALVAAPREAAPPPPPPPSAGGVDTHADPFSDNPVTRWLFGGNTIVRVGMVVLFFGVAFLLKYAAERDLVPIEIRLAAVTAGAIVLLVFGWRLRERRSGYALMLQGGGIGVLYLTVFAAMRIYQLLPPTFAFAVLTGVAIFSAMLAVLQDSRALAITGVAGGFLAPILTSTGGGNHVALFSFYALLDAGILGIAMHKAWRELNLLGFVFTCVIGLMWGAQHYQPELYPTTEPFLVLFFLFYVAIAVLFALRQAPRLAHYVDGTLVFGTPLIAFGMQTVLVRGMEFGAAWSAFVLATFYLSLATILYSRKQQTLVLLVESFLALGIGFATLAVPLAFDGRLTSAVWAVEGAAIVWTGVRQQRLLARVFGLLLQFAAGIAFVAGHGAAGVTPVLNSAYIGAVMVAAAGLFCSYYLHKNAARVRPQELAAATVLFVWGVVWWFGAGLIEIDHYAPAVWGRHPHLMFFAGSCGLFALLWRRFDWEAARYVALASVPLSTVVLVWMATAPGAHTHPFAAQAWISWIIAFAVHIHVLRLHEGRDEPSLDHLHAAGFWLLAVMLSWEVGWQIDDFVEGRRVWPLIAWALVPGALITLFAVRGERLGWPVDAHRHAYLYAGALPLAVFLLGWILYANFVSNGDPAPLPYVSLVNPLDLAQAGALLAVASWFIGVRRLGLPLATLPSTNNALRVLGVIVFIALNGVLLRTLHHYAGVPFRLDAMLHSVLVQMAFSLFWTLLAFAAMVFATRRGLRVLWAIGATLLGVVVAKLFLVDLANSGTVERWVSFIGVGLLVIVIGYFAPVPPKAKEVSA
jgi:uncharacterized membrane protein